MKVVRQLNLKKKENTGDRGVIPTNLYIFWVLIPVYFTFRNVEINETVALCRKKSQSSSVGNSTLQPVLQ